MGEASVNSSILKVFSSIDHNETDYQTKKVTTRPNCKHLQTTNLMWLKTEICLRKKENIPNIATSLIVKDFAGWSIYRQIGISVVILIRKTIAT